MKNAHLRFGWLTYVKSTEKTTTSIRLYLDRFIGEMLPDPPRQAKAHFISVWVEMLRSRRSARPFP